MDTALLFHEVQCALRQASKAMEELVTLCNVTHTNTQKNIKNKSVSLAEILKNVSTKYEAALTKSDILNGPPQTSTKKETADMASQTTFEEQKTTKKASNGGKNISELLKEEACLEVFKKLQSLKWQREVFNRIKILEDTDGNTPNSVILVNTSDKPDENGVKELINRYGVLETLVNSKGLSNGKIESAKISVELGSDEKLVCNKYVLPLAMEDAASLDTMRTFDMIKELRSIIGDVGQKWKEEFFGKVNAGCARRLLEYIFMDKQNVMFILPDLRGRGAPRDLPRASTAVNRATKPKPNGQVIFKVEGKSYSEVTKKLQGDINLTNIGVEVLSIRPRRNEDMAIEVKGGVEKALLLQKAMKSAGTAAAVREETVVMQIADIDFTYEGTTLMEEIRGRYQELQEDQLELISLGNMRSGSKTARIAFKGEAANVAKDLEKSGRIKLGWISCRIRKEVKLMRCFKCLGFGHVGRDCQNDDRSDRCMKCGQSGHKAKDCVNDVFCLECNKGGHRMDRNSCPRYRAIYQEQVRRTPAPGRINDH